jgi:hypothetical protein
MAKVSANFEWEALGDVKLADGLLNSPRPPGHLLSSSGA